jgi:hypothetical protein
MKTAGKVPVLAGFSAFLLTIPLGGALPPEGTLQRVNADAAAMQTFQQRLNTYVRLRNELARRLKPLSPTANADELTGRQEALAKMLRTARAGAKPGDLIPEPVAKLLLTSIAIDLKRRSAAGEKTTFSESMNAPRPAVNQDVPDDEALAAVPPLLLKNLPPLPDNLQYRFYGRHLLLIDGDPHIIADYLANVLPPR